MEKTEEQRSVLQVDQVFMKMIMSRNCSMGHSSHSFRAPAKVPFKWESQPGTPKNPPSNNYSHKSVFDPPPQQAARDLQMPTGPKKGHFWKKMFKKAQKGKSYSVDHIDFNDYLADHKSVKSDNDRFMCWSSSSLSTNTTSSSCNSLVVVPPSKLHGVAKGFIRWIF